MKDLQFYSRSFRLSRAEVRVLSRLCAANGAFVHSSDLYKTIRGDEDIELDSFNPHVRVVMHKLRRKLFASDLQIASRSRSGYRLVM